MSVVREVLFSVLLASTLLDTAAAQGAWTTGIATFTGVPEDTPADQFNAAAVKSVPDAACGYGTLTAAQYPGFLLASVSPKSAISQGPQTGCGTCLEVKCTAETCDNNTPVPVMVFDSCVECAANQINLYATAFSKFAPLDLGRVGIQYKQVPCPFTGGIIVHILTYRPDKGGYIKLSLRNVKGPAGINSVAFRSTGTTNNWRPLTNTYGAVWEASKLTPAPLDLQITKTDGTSTMLSSCKYSGAYPTYSNGAITDIDMECAANFNT